MNIFGYQLGREIVVEEYGSVYNALELESSKTVTVKMFHSALSTNPEFCQHVKSTTELLLHKKIGCITPIKQAIESAEGCYIITDYFPCAQNQQPLLTAFTVDEVLNFGLQLANSLSQLHDLGLVHAAVSTSNLLFPNFSQVTLGPNSFPRTFKNNNPASSLKISIDESAYIAPEFSTGLDAHSDFYSLGVVLFELLFKTKPFVADNLQQLQFNKENMLFSLPNNSAQKLTPLFKKLLAFNPQHRIANAADFIQITEQCGYNFDGIDDADNQAKLPVTPTRNKSSASQTKIIFLYSVAAGLSMLAILNFFVLDKSADKPIKISVNKSAILATSLAPETPRKNVQIRSRDSNSIVLSLMSKSQQQMSQDNYGGALISINVALKEFPDHVGAQQLKNKIELEFEIRSYLRKAEKLITQRKLTRPINDNAYDTYKKLAAILPANDNRAIEGFQKITTRYYQLADYQVIKNQYETANYYIAKGLGITPSHPQLLQLKRHVKQQEAKHLAQQKLINNEQLATQQQLRLQQQQRQQKLAEENRLAAAEKEKLRKLQQQQERQRLAQLRIERNKNDRLISDARKLLTRNRLSLDSLNHALEIHSELTETTITDSRIPNLFQQIIESYGELARTQKNTPDLSAAFSTVKQGLALDRKNSDLLKIQQELNSLIVIEE